MYQVLSTVRCALVYLSLLWLAGSGAALASELNNGGYVDGKITTAGDSNLWTFIANANEVVHLNVIDQDNKDLALQAVIYSPDGNVVFDSTNDNIVHIHNLQAKTTGTYTLEIKDGHTNASRGNSQLGSYRIYFTNHQVAEHGELKEQGFVSETLDTGDIDTWQFTAEAGELISLSVVDTHDKDLAVHGTLISPDGSVLQDRGHDSVLVYHNIQTKQTGTYTLVIKDGHTSKSRGHMQTGHYQIYFYKPGKAEHGALKNNGYVEETLDTGDIDSWTFTARSGEFFTLSLIDIQSQELAVHGTIFSPDGTVVSDGGHDDVQLFLNVQARQTGEYTFMVKDGHTSSSRGHSQTGPYRVYLNQPTASEHGALKNTGVVEKIIEYGDLDSWHFDAAEGQTLSLTFTDVLERDLAIEAIVYAPDGSRFLAGKHDKVLRFNTVKINQPGRYYVQVNDAHTRRSRGHGQTGSYQIRMTLIPIMNTDKTPSVNITGQTSGQLNQQMVLGIKVIDIPEPATYSWKLLSSNAAMTNPLVLMYKKTAPTVIFTPPSFGTHQLEATVTGNGKQYTATHTVTVTNHPPAVSLSTHRKTESGNVISLIAKVEDTDGQELSGKWTITNKPAGSQTSLSNINQFNADFTPDAPGVYRFTFNVSDTIDEVSQQLDVTVTEEKPQPVPPEPEPKPAPSEAKSCDINNDYFVDKYDIERISKALNSPITSATQPLDINNDSRIDQQDITLCENECSYKGCNSALFQ